MTITLLYFAAIRETTSLPSEQVPLESLPTRDTDGLWAWLQDKYPAASGWRGHVRLAVNQEFTRANAPLTAGDEVALIPPVSGGSQSRWSSDHERFVVTTDALDERVVEDKVQRPEAGAVVTFTGRVRNHTRDYSVDYLVYEAYEAMALKKLEECARHAAEEFGDVLVAIHHRFGKLDIGEAAVVIAVSSPHRQAAFAACQAVIDRLKQEVPIWKKEVGPDGREWVGWGP